MKRSQEPTYCHPSKRWHRTIDLIFLLTLILVFSTASKASAQQAAATRPPQSSGGDFGVGIGFCVHHEPGEADLIDAGGGEDIDKLDLFFDWHFLRLGFNISNAQVRFSAYDQDWNAHLKKSSTYLVLRLAGEFDQSPMEISGFAGIAYVDATFTLQDQQSSSSADAGYIVGGAAIYDLGHIAIGPQVSIISTRGDFDGIKIATGGIQYLIILSYRF
jgi:hypothetical protein